MTKLAVGLAPASTPPPAASSNGVSHDWPPSRWSHLKRCRIETDSPLCIDPLGPIKKARAFAPGDDGGSAAYVGDFTTDLLSRKDAEWRHGSEALNSISISAKHRRHPKSQASRAGISNRVHSRARDRPSAWSMPARCCCGMTQDPAFETMPLDADAAAPRRVQLVGDRADYGSTPESMARSGFGPREP